MFKPFHGKHKPYENIEKQNTKSIFSKSMHGYLGNRGYTVLKTDFTEHEIAFIKKELTVKPFVQSMGGSSGDVQFPVYRESSYKLYVPRYFGERTFGPPQENKISQGVSINIPFKGSLRENQIPVVETFMNKMNNPNNPNYAGGLLELPCAFGKCLAINTPIIMYDGTIKKVQHVEVGDLLMGDDSTPRKVLTLARGQEQMYKITSKDEVHVDMDADTNIGGTDATNEHYTVNESHILSLKCISNYDKLSYKKDTIIDISILDYIDLIKTHPEVESLLYGYRVPLEFKDKELEIDPYVLGYWLGRWNDCQNIPYTKIKHRNIPKNAFNNGTFNEFVNTMCFDKNNHIHIPHHYKCNSREKRIALLAGIMDSAIYLIKPKNKYIFALTRKSNQLTKDIIYIIRSLGFKYTKTQNPSYYIYNGRRKYSNMYTITIETNNHVINDDDDDDINVRNDIFSQSNKEDVLAYPFTIQKMKVDDYYGFEIDGNHRFVLGDFTVTHNTVLSLKLISEIKKKTIIIVHKEFLGNQWVERIAEFLPTARVGRIQGGVVDIENKDIVIGMLQSLSMKEYDASIFDSFGLTIIDEVHHISSEVFSRVLFKLVTKYMIGLSATMERKDGTTNIFKMFLGDVVFKGEREKGEYDVIVRAIQYKANDEEFNNVVLDYRGNVQYSTMISKLCAYNHRTEFILKIVKDMLIENPNQQIMILAHNRNILSYLFDAITSRNIAMVGNYLGGMKEKDLKETEKKQIVLATYSMAAEALDIKTLGSLIMATPKTDIEQSVGRILREKEGKKIIVDIIDDHTPFKNQWNKRRQFYKKQNYKMIQTSNTKYSANTGNWNTIHTAGLSSSSCSKSNKNIEYVEEDDNDYDGDILNKSMGCLIRKK